MDSHVQNNFTAQLASEYLSGQDDTQYWLGMQSHNDLQTNTLQTDAGGQISLYYGHWAISEPDIRSGKCVEATLIDNGAVRQEWGLYNCEALRPFMCRMDACPSGTFHCSNGKCVSRQFVCDGSDDCGDDSDELNCPGQCKHHLESSGSIIETNNHPGKYEALANCKWTLEGPRGTNIVLRFSDFETETNFDTVQILGGGRTEATAVNIATLSGNLDDIKDQTFVSASNFMIIKFKSDGSVEKRGFRASWSTEAQSCGADLVATSTGQIMVSPNYPDNYPGGLECLHTITAPKGKIITLEIEDLDMEPDRDYLLIKDGDSADSPTLAKLTGHSNHPRFVVSTGNKLYLYTKTDQADSRKGYRIKFYEGCSSIIDTYNGTLSSPAYGIGAEYPANQDCVYRIRHPEGGKLSLLFSELNLHPTDKIEVTDGQNGLELHPSGGFTGSETPDYFLTADSGEMVLRFVTDAVKNNGRFLAQFSADCPQLEPGKDAISSSLFDTAFGSRAVFSCPEGQVFATGVDVIETECMPGGKWSHSYIPDCQPVYCGPVPQIDNGFAVDATNVSLGGSASYQCYAGFGFPSGFPIETIVCTADGTWSFTPICQASQCPPLPEVEHATADVLAGRGLNYGTVMRYECDPGYQRSGMPVLLCQSNGTWSSAVPSCSRIRCYDFPELANGYIIDKSKEYFYGDTARAECYSGYNRIGSNVITCSEDQTFTGLPECEDKNECDAFQCDFQSTECENKPGSYHCKCRKGFEPNLDCRPIVNLGLSDGGVPDEAIAVSAEEEGYPKELSRLNSEKGWCGTSSTTGPNTDNWIRIDLKAPTIIRGFRTQGVRRLDGRLAYPTAIRLMYTDDLSDKMREFRNVDGSPVEFRVLDGASTSIMNLPVPIEARYLRLNILNFENNPCMRIELVGCQKQSCNDVNECLENNGGCQQKCLNK